MEPALIGAISALCGALIGASSSIFQLALNHKREVQKHEDTLLVTALTLLVGTENQRSCGISIIEGKYIKSAEYGEILAPALGSQAVFLMLHTENRESRTEFYNWVRILKLVDLLVTQHGIRGDYYGEVGNAFYIKKDQKNKEGLNIPFPILKGWAKKFAIEDLSVEI
jgi:hypothetical protein